MGVPQGIIVSVSLFILKINSIVGLVNTKIEKSLFVDDFSIDYSSLNTSMAELKTTKLDK